MHIHYTRWAVLTVLGLLTACHQAPKTAGDMVPDRVIAPMAKARTVEDLTPYIASATLCPTDGAQDFAVPPFKTLLRQDAFYFLNGSAVWRLSRDGKELRQIGRSGRGPGEYLAVEDFCLDVSDSEVLCMTSYRGGGVLRYSAATGEFLGQIVPAEMPSTPTGIIPLQDGGFALYFTGFDAPGSTIDPENPAWCLWSYDKTGAVNGRQLLLTDFNIPFSMLHAVTEISPGRYILVPESSYASCPVFEDGRIREVLSFDLGPKYLPQGYALQGGGDPWDRFGDIMDSDYYKLVSNVHMTPKRICFSLFGAGGSTWCLLSKANGSQTILWPQIIMTRLLATDGETFYFGIPPFAEQDKDNGIFERDALVRYLVEQGILPFPSYTWQMVAVHFKD